MVQRVFVDSNVLASRTCLDWLFFLRLENDGMFQLHATEDVFSETIRVLRRRHPRLSGGVITDYNNKIRKCMDEVLTEFSEFESFSGADEDDYHVHSAAVSSKADLILTNNAPSDITQSPDNEPYEIISADEFFMLVTASNPRCLVPITRQQFEFWGSKRKSLPIDVALMNAGCSEFAKRVRKALQEIALST